ncbi:two-component sensor histidine kinase [Xylophilus rhododendri]|uniref:histidine kinase n=1 Tax=Xylophilus rhododendri TaxID=2697032 RepID=A0A857JAX5_9BURK|nr:HAMP domain-containing sensor histidine kinase [Xylophilus rhododendri]QHJ00354.1 two-component sensor histidine kinase [Xylophilus rhododendri]
MRRLTLTQRLSLVFALLLLVCCGASAWLQVRSNRMHELEVVQGLSRDLAANIALSARMTLADDPSPDRVRALFDQLMVVNPSVEVYLLDAHGRITGHAAPAGKLRRSSVDLAPVRRLLAGGMLPILGDDPRSDTGRKVFSAAPVSMPGAPDGFLYVVLLGEAHDREAAMGNTGAVLRTALLSIALVALACLAAGLAAFSLITRPLRRLTRKVQDFDMDGAPAALPAAPPAPSDSRDEIARLDAAFGLMAARMGEQWLALKQQDLERRELIANVSHDLRTPLSSLHGYLETLSHKDASLDAAERRRYLGIALEQSRNVGRLAQSLFELARLEYGFVEPEREPFLLPDLLQDVFEKFELAAASLGVALEADIAPALPAVDADLGLVERVLSNLLDNALRHVPAGGKVRISLAAQPDAAGVSVTVADTGPGIPPDLRPSLFLQPFNGGGARRGGGLGLRIVHRILALHGSGIALLDEPGWGAVFRFRLPAAAPARP